MEPVDTDAASPGSPLREPEPTGWLEDFEYYEENEDLGTASPVVPSKEPKPPRPQDESDYDDAGESVGNSARNSPVEEIQPAQPQQVSDHNDNEPVNNSAPNSPSESEQDEFEYDDDTNDSAFPESPSREANMAAEYARTDAERREAELAQQSTSNNMRTFTPPADWQRLRLYGASIYCALIGSPERLSKYQELQLDLTDRERWQRIEDVVDERNPCYCPTNTFDLCTKDNPYMESLVNKLRKMPKCLHLQAYRDVLVYFRYLHRKHRRMLLRSSPINNISC